MSKNIFIIAIIALVLGGGYMYYSSNYSSTRPVNQPVVEEVKIPESISPAVSEIPPTTAGQASAKEFSMDAASFTFSVKEIRVKQGDRVKLTLNNKQGFHDWVLDEFTVRTKQLKEGVSETVEFTADKTGTFEYYCSVGNHRQQGMVGKFIVE